MNECRSTEREREMFKLLKQMTEQLKRLTDVVESQSEVLAYLVKKEKTK